MKPSLSSGGLLGLQQLGVERGGRDEVAQAQAGREDFGKRAQVQAALRVVGAERGRRRRVAEPQVAVGVVFQQRQAGARGRFGHGAAARVAHAAAGGVLEVGQQIGKARALATLAGVRGQRIGQHAFVVAGHGVHARLHGREGLQRAQVGGRFHQHAAAAVDEYLGRQIQPLLRAGGDEHLRGVGADAELAHVLRHPLTQRGQSFAGGVLQGGLAVLREHALGGLAHGLDGKGFGRRQSASQADDAGPLGDLEDLADHRGVHLGGALGQLPGRGEGLRGVHVDFSWGFMP
jgi:hypothetical protein